MVCSLVISAWVVEFYEDDNGCPVRQFLDACEERRRAKLLAIVQLLAEQGPTLPFPYSSQVRGRIRELRTHDGNEHYRVLYFGTPERGFVLLHAFVKRTSKTPLRDIDQAEARMLRWLDRRRQKGKR